MTQVVPGQVLEALASVALGIVDLEIRQHAQLFAGAYDTSLGRDRREVLVDHSGQVKLADFNVGKVADADLDVSLTRYQAVPGTLYVARIAYSNDGYVGPQSEKSGAMRRAFDQIFKK